METRNFVQAEIVPARPDAIRRSDVVSTIDTMLAMYGEQQRAMLATVQQDVGGRGFLSDAAAVAERRKTSRLYLILYGSVAGITMGGLALVAWLAGVNGGLAVAGWMFATGATTLLLAWVRHGDEFAHSPEGIARHLLDWHGSIAEYDAETRRLVARWDVAAERQRLAAADAERRHAMELAQLRIAEMDAKRRHNDAIRQQREVWHDEAPAAIVAQPPAAEQPPTATAGDAFNEMLLAWVVGLYDGGITGDGIITRRAPWAARSAWTEGDKQRAKRILCNGRPALIEETAGGRYRLRLELFGNPAVAAETVARRLDDNIRSDTN